MARMINLANLTPFQAASLRDPGYLPGQIVIPNCAMVRINWTLADGKSAHNILHTNYTGTPALSNTVAESLRAGFASGAQWTALAAFLAAGAALASVTVLDLRSITGIEYTSTGTAAPGTSSGTGLPDETAAVVTLRTNNRGPSGRGRFYVPGWASNAVGAGGIIAAAAVTALTAWAQIAVNGTNATVLGGPLVIALPARQAYTSPATGRQFPARAAGTVAVVNLVVRDNHWDSQRRRGLK